MAHWEYRKIDLKSSGKFDDIDILNRVGEEGWELVGITVANVAYLKRQIGEQAAPARSTRRKSTTSTG